MTAGARWHEELMLLTIVVSALVLGALRGCSQSRGLAMTEMSANALRAEVAGGRGPSAEAAGSLSSLSELAARLDLNAASYDQLMTLPGIGEVRAREIIATREALGQFDSIDQLVAIQGIGPRSLERLRPRLKVEQPAKPSATQVPALSPPVATPSAASPAPAPLAIPAPAAPPPPQPVLAAAADSSRRPISSPVNINKAGLEELMSLEGIGEVKARAIMAHRQAKGPFRTTRAIMDVRGIGEAIFRKNASRLVLE